MMDYTDRHFRHLVRLVSNRTLLYTEMVSANAIAYESRNVQPDSNHVSENQPDECGLAKWRNTQKNDEHPALYLGRFLASSPIEGPSVLQLGGSDPQLLQEAARVVHEMSLSSSSLPFACDYSGLNLNCGCPSPKVAGKGCFGAALMSDPGLVAKLASALYEGGKGQFPVSVKCRIGTDDPTSSSNTPNMSTRDGSHRYYYGEEEYRTLCHFIETVARDGIVRDFSIHARIAVLGKSFSPADNRRIPPLQYGVVRRLAREYPTLRFTLNGGVGTIAEVEDHLTECPELAGIMVGRAWTADPWSFAMADSVLYRDHHGDGDKNRWQILQQFAQYADHEESTWGPVKIRRFLIRAVSPLFAGEPNAKKYRIALDKIAGLPKIVQAEGRLTTSGPPISELILDAAQRHLSEETLFSTARESYERRYWLKQEPSR
jgi:tRNA-dihydrouridine synthase A